MFGVLGSQTELLIYTPLDCPPQDYQRFLRLKSRRNERGKRLKATLKFLIAAATRKKFLPTTHQMDTSQVKVIRICL